MLLYYLFWMFMGFILHLYIIFGTNLLTRGPTRIAVFFARTHFLACEDVAGGSQQSGGIVFFTKYSGPSGGSQLSGGGIIIFRIIRRHFLAAAVDPATSLSTYSPRPMEVVP